MNSRQRKTDRRFPVTNCFASASLPALLPHSQRPSSQHAIAAPSHTCPSKHLFHFDHCSTASTCSFKASKAHRKHRQDVAKLGLDARQVAHPNHKPTINIDEITNQREQGTISSLQPRQVLYTLFLFILTALTCIRELSKFPALQNFEQQTSVPKVYVVLGLAALYFFLVFFNIGGEFLVNTAGFALPAYYSLQALFSIEPTDDYQWLTVCPPGLFARHGSEKY